MARSRNPVRNSKEAKNMEKNAKTSNNAKTKRRAALSGWPMLLAWLAMIVFAFHSSTHMVGAGDTWVAMACGRHFLDHGVDTVEPFSANSHKAGPTKEGIETWPDWAQGIANTVGLKTVQYWHPTGWVNQNWLTHVIFYWLTHRSPFADAENRSYNTLVYWKFAIYIITVICVYYATRLLGVNPALSAAFACFAMFVGRSFFDIRPAGFSNLLVAVFLLILVLTTYRNVLYIWLIVPVVVFWCDVHGGYVYAFIMLVPFVALNLLTSFSKKRFVSIGLKGIYHTIAAGFAAFLAMIVLNPFHLTNLTHTFIISVSEHAKMWRTVNEWHPGFEWSNPVGTSFPFLVLYILCLGVPIFWLYSGFLKPRFLKAPKNELEKQKQSFTKRSKIFGCLAALFICRVTFIGFSFTNILYSPGSDGLYGTRDDVIDLASFFVHTVFVIILLLSIFKNVHFIYLQIPLALLALQLAGPRNNYAGAYFYPFVLLPVYVMLHILVSLFSKTIKIKPENVAFPAATAVVAFLFMVAIFNPFRFGRLFNVGLQFQRPLDNRALPQELQIAFKNRGISLSENAVVSVEKLGTKWQIIDNDNKYPVSKEQRRIYIYKTGSPVWQVKEALHLRRIWIPQYEGKYRLRYLHLFTVLYILNIASVIVWLTVPYLRSLFRRLPDKTSQQSQTGPLQLPKIDLALIAIAALSVYMAYRSRRFVPIAAFAACPVLAMFIDQMTRTISAAHNFHQKNHLTVRPMPYGLQIFFIAVGAMAVIGFGTSWTLKFKCVYLDPWPTDPKLSSVFMRMTASDAKPFYALDFIRENNLQGKMFNYWTEGGFIAYGQNPDPNTGKTPLQLFMDGRAQAAYEPDTYTLWSSIMSGGQIAQNLERNAKVRKRGLNADDYTEIGDWLNKQLKAHKVWVVLMPTGQFRSSFVKGLEHNSDWRLAFLNNKQKLFVDLTTPQGEKLLNDIPSRKTVYPDEFSRNLIIAHHMLVYRQDQNSHRLGLELAIKAFDLNPSQAPMQKVIYAARFAELRPVVVKFCRDYLDKFTKEKDSMAKQHGYHHRIVAALNAATYLRQIAQRQKNTELAQSYRAIINEYNRERNLCVQTKRW